jgi:hypothetical protein
MSEGPIERAAERSGATGLSCNRMHRNENDGMMLSQRSAPSLTCFCGAAIRCEKLTDPHSPIMGTKSRDRLSGSSVRMAAQKEVESAVSDACGSTTEMRRQPERQSFAADTLASRSANAR